MSLRFFHVLFIVVSCLMALVVGLWALNAWRADGSASWLALAALAFGGGGLMMVYASRFLQKTRKLGVAALCIAGTLGMPAEGLACAVCLGATDSPLRTGMDWGILALLGITGFVLACFASFFVYLARQARAAEVREAGRHRPDSNQGEPVHA